MKKKIHYTDEPIEMEVIEDFLPPPDQLVLKEETVKVTISLSKPSVEFFKKQAKKRRIPYQKMIRRVIDLYTDHYQENDFWIERAKKRMKTFNRKKALTDAQVWGKGK